MPVRRRVAVTSAVPNESGGVVVKLNHEVSNRESNLSKKFFIQLNS